MKETYECVWGVQGEAKLDHMGAKGRIRGDVMLMAADPENVRFDVISPFGVTLATLTSNGREFMFFDMKNGLFLEGPPDACNIARLTQVKIPPHAIVELLRGQAPLLVHKRGEAKITWSGDGHYVVQIPSLHDARQEIHLQPNPADFGRPFRDQRLRVTHVSVMQRDYVHYSVAMSDHTDVATMPPREDELGIDPPIPPSGPPCRAEVPRRIAISVPYTRDDMRFRYEEVGLNPPLPDGVFAQPVPGGVTKRRAICK